jgi:hypothetical protein
MPNQTQQKYDGPVFHEKAKQGLKEVLARVAQLPGVDITWGYNIDYSELVISGIKGGDITFTHPARARTYLDGLLDGFDLGFGAGRDSNDDGDYSH